MEFQVLYHELAQSTEMIRTLLAGVGQEEAQVKPSPGKWSILEVVCHLYDEEREDFREHLDFILHRQHEEWHPIAPQLVPTPISTSTLVVIPTITPTALPTQIPYEQLIPVGWTQYKTALVEIWLPPAYKLPKSNTSGLTSLAGSELTVSKPAAKASLYALWVNISYEPLTTDSLVSFLDVKFQSLPPEYRMVGRQEVLINSVPAEKVTIEARVKNFDVNELVFVFQDGGTVWYVVYAAQINDFYENLVEFEASVRTFRLVK